MKLVSITTSDGETLEARVTEPARIRAAVVVAHPHPLRGGTFDSPVVVALQSALEREDIISICPNFRGAGHSTGTHDHGTAEQLDLLAALEWIATEAPHLAVHVAGYSFGGRVALGIADGRIASWSTIAPAIVGAADSEQRERVGADPRPKLIVVGDRDEIVPATQLTPLVTHWNATTVDIVAGADHFWVGHVSRVVNRVVDHISAVGHSMEH
jgi:uncharacterized protein